MSCLRSLHLNFAGFLAKKRFFQVLFELLLLPGCFPYINNEIMSDDKKSRELEWFDLETRMRELLYIQLEPVIGKAREDREQHNSLKIHCRSVSIRIHYTGNYVFIFIFTPWICVDPDPNTDGWVHLFSMFHGRC